MNGIVPNTVSPEGWGIFAGRVYGGTRPAPDGGPPLLGDEAEPMPAKISFGEMLESLNPLQHMPGVGMIYREATGSAAPIAARILVGTALGGPMGFLGGVASAMLEVTGFVGSLRAVADGRDQPTAFMAWGEKADTATIARGRQAYQEQMLGNMA
ncbi:hypothetical protein J8J14_00650 [Roseomonas sp. SSH11]|uniref:Uncharacterized protein n=1 Tax=Pararoseomonas baculiformis TaxID=2820812 RepID=A0ABS4A9R1_9PROT|nr:hypothetical protein [Pararoseomonas baculiformis]MBP0443273.1 hypothetical protein [Pararoseomonas baculiformis]